MHIHNNSVLHYLYNMAFGLVIYSKAEHSRPRPENPKTKAKKFGLKAKAKAKAKD